MKKTRFANIEISLKDEHGNVIHSVPLRTGFSKEAAEELTRYHQVDIVDEITRALVSELTFKFEEDDQSQLEAVIKELVESSANFVHKAQEDYKT